MTGADVIQARGDAAHRGSLAFRNRVFGQRRIDADMHVRVDAAGKGQIVLAVENLLRLLYRKLGRETADLAALDADVEAIDGSLFGTHDASVLDDDIEQFRHSAFLTNYASYRF